MVLVCAHSKSPNTTKNRVSAGTRDNPQWHFLAKVPFWEGASKRGFTICDTQKLCSAKNTIFIVLSAKHSFADMKESNLKKKNSPQKIRGCLPKCKRCFLVCFVFFGGFVFLCFVLVLFVKSLKKGYFPTILEFLFYFVPTKACL